MKFFEAVAPADSQDAPGLKNAIFATFHKHSLKSVALKDALKEFIEPADTSLMHLFYLY